MEPRYEKIDALRDLLELRDRSVASFVTLKGLVERADFSRGILDVEESGDVAFVFVGPKEKLDGVLRESKEDGSLTFELTLPGSPKT